MAQKDVNVKRIKEFILDDGNNIGEVIEYLEYYLCDDDYCYRQLESDVIRAVFKALFVLLRRYEGNNKTRVDYLISFLQIKTENNEFEELNKIKIEIEDLGRKVENLKNRQKDNIKKPLDRLQKIYNSIELNTNNTVNNAKLKRLEFLIFGERNIELIKRYLDSYDSSFEQNNGYDIFSLIVEKYISLNSSNRKEINYYFHVILLFLKSNHGDTILENKNKYLSIIYKSSVKCKHHVIRLIKLLNSKFEVRLDEFGKQYNVNFEFPEVILNEVYTFKTLQNDRVNFTNQECVTIDGKGAKCLDDALYIERNTDGTYTLYVHITDIPSFVPYDSITNSEAKKRVESLYLCNSTIPMYPFFISEGTSSLLSNNNRNVISCIFKLDSDFNLLEDKFEVVKRKIKVAYNMSYEEVDCRLINPTNSKLDEMLINLCLFAVKRRGSNRYKEIYRYYENLFSRKSHHESYKIYESDAANIVHESMILTNYSIAKYFKDLSLPYIFRMLSVPGDNFIENKIKDGFQSNIFTENFLEELKTSYIKAIYTSFPSFHSGLKLECYSHSTSPARRYADAMGQYIIHDLIFDSHLSDSDIYKWEYRVEEIIKYLNKRKEELELFQKQYNYLSHKKMLKK